MKGNKAEKAREEKQRVSDFNKAVKLLKDTKHPDHAAFMKILSVRAN